MKKPEVQAHAHNPGSGVVETGGSLEITGQLSSPICYTPGQLEILIKKKQGG